MTVKRDPVTGQLLKGSVLNPNGRKPVVKPKKPLTLKQMRDIISLRLPDLLDVVMDQAMQGDVSAASLLISRTMPSLRSVEIGASDGALPVLVMNIGQQAILQNTIEGACEEVSEGGGVDSEGG